MVQLAGRLRSVRVLLQKIDERIEKDPRGRVADHVRAVRELCVVVEKTFRIAAEFRRAAVKVAENLGYLPLI